MVPIHTPKSSTFTRRYGFTLIEMLIVLGILAILVGMTTLFLIPTLHRAKVTADQVALKTLNDATMVYAIQRGMPSGDIFAGIEEDEERLEALLSAGAIQAIPQPKEPGASFCWDVTTQSWYNSLYEHSAEEPIISSFDFTALNPADFPKTGNWSKGANGFCSNWGLLFIANPREEYTIRTTATLSAGTDGGYGILFETVITPDNKDTGYAFQFDRAYSDGALVIRPRENGVEKSPVYRFTDRAKLPSRTDNPTWWTSEHRVTLRITKGPNTGQKTLAVWIDDTLMFDNFTFSAVVSPANNYTGLRAWTKQTCFRSMQIQ